MQVFIKICVVRELHGTPKMFLLRPWRGPVCSCALCGVSSVCCPPPSLSLPVVPATLHAHVVAITLPMKDGLF